MNPAWVTKKELLMDQVKKSSETIRMRNYGRIIQNMVDYIATIEDEETKHLSLCYIASCMRQKNLIWNKDQEASIERIREDIERISNYRLDCSGVEFDSLQRSENGGQKPRKIKR